MQFIDNLDQIPHDKKSFLTIGTFDGVHLGHQTIINQLVSECRLQDSRSIVMTFEPHPQTVINPKRMPDIQILTTISEKREIFESLGVDLLIAAPFNETMASLSAEEFVQQILINKIGFSKMFIGHDHVFGRNRSGNHQTLQTMAPHYHFEIEKIEAYKSHRVLINSTLIRKLLYEGKLEQATQYMGRPYQITGTVKKGDGRGRRLGIPTANLAPSHPSKLIPMSGVYGTIVRINGEVLKGVTNIGHRPTFYGYKTRSVIETHILDFDRDIYEQTIHLQFVTRIRDEKHFNSSEELKTAIAQDIAFYKKH